MVYDPFGDSVEPDEAFDLDTEDDFDGLLDEAALEETGETALEGRRLLSTRAINSRGVGVNERDVSRVSSMAGEHPGLRAILDGATRLLVLEGDKSPQIAGFLDDLISEIRILILEVKRDPTLIVLASLSSQERTDQLAQIDKLIKTLEARKRSLEVN